MKDDLEHAEVRGNKLDSSDSSILNITPHEKDDPVYPGYEEKTTAGVWDNESLYKLEQEQKERANLNLDDEERIPTGVK